MNSQKKNYFLIGIKGTAMVHLAVLLKKQGHEVTGFDIEEEFPTDIVLKENQIDWSTSNTLPDNTDVVVYSAGHHGIHSPFIKEAKKRNIHVVHQIELIGQLLTEFKTSLAVAGCHGKTTTSSLLAYVLLKMGKEPSYLIGTPSFNEYPGGAMNGHEYFVIEADEYAISPPDDLRPKLHFLKPTYSIITNIDFDHPDVYADLEATKAVFRKYCEQTAAHYPNIQCLVLCGEDEPVMDVASHLPQHTYITYGYKESDTYSISNIEYSSGGSVFDINHKGMLVERFQIALFGDKNILNAAGVIALLLHLGFDPEQIKESIKGFTGAKRRFEFIEEKNGVSLFDDYAHHPAEISAVISAARKRFPDRNIIVIFQPHTYSRTHSLKDEFVRALAKADQSIILPIFGSARETMTSDSISSAELEVEAQKQHNSNVHAANDTKDALQQLKKVLQPGDIVITAGAGDVYKLKSGIISLL